MADVGKMIAQVRKERGMSQTALAGILGVTTQTVTNYESGRRKPDLEMLEAISDALDRPVEFFIGRGEKLEQLNNAKKGDKLPPSITPISQMAHRYVPMIGSVAAGEPLYAEENYADYIDAPRKADYALKVEGDSMMPTFLNGDVIFIHQQNTINSGDIGVVLIDDSACVKHIYPQENGLLLISDNPAYAPRLIQYAEHDCVKVLGRVCGFTRMI